MSENGVEVKPAPVGEAWFKSDENNAAIGVTGKWHFKFQRGAYWFWCREVTQPEISEIRASSANKLERAVELEEKLVHARIILSDTKNILADYAASLRELEPDSPDAKIIKGYMNEAE